jgi:hypothetical protein
VAQAAALIAAGAGPVSVQLQPQQPVERSRIGTGHITTFVRLDAPATSVTA